jgi:hypothetical protein
MKAPQVRKLAAIVLAFISVSMDVSADHPAGSPKAFIDGTGPGWKPLGAEDFVNVNGAKDTWTWKGGNVHCTGMPIGVCRTQKQFTNFELVAQWRHEKRAGNSGIFVWAAEAALKDLKPGLLPSGGIEVQILDHGYAEQYETKQKKKADWFTTHGVSSRSAHRR